MVNCAALVLREADLKVFGFVGVFAAVLTGFVAVGHASDTSEAQGTPLNAQGQSLGGNLRSGPGTSYESTGSLQKGTPVTILANTGVTFNGYDWFEVDTNDGRSGFQWGGIMCSDDLQIPGIYQQCGGGSVPAEQIAGSPEPLNYQGKSFGGNLRLGPGMNYPQTGSLPDGTWVTILRNAGNGFEGYDWFEVATDKGVQGFQWGGVLCSNGTQLPGISKRCDD